MAAGTITVTKAPSVCSPKTRAVHVFLTESGDNFNSSQCFNNSQFILNPNQECLLITNLMAISVKLDTENMQAPLQFDHSSQLRLCYSISIKHPGMALIVGEKTPLSLLLKTGCVAAHPFCVTRDDWFKLFSQQDTYPKKRTSDTVAPPAAKKWRL